MLTETEELLKDPSRKLIAAPRQGQILMGRRVAETMSSGGVAFVEAPVGTGKSYAYLVPAALSPERTVVSTAKKSLQDQLIDQDLPAVRRATGKLFTFSVLKGASNYFCAARARGLKSQKAKAEIAAWQSTLDDVVSDGDVASFPGGYPDYWPEVSVEDCEGDKCPHYDQCGYAKVVSAASVAKIVVTNHHLLAHTLLRGSKVFGDYKNLVIDEAHQFPEALRSAQTQSLSKPELNNLYRRYSAAGGVLGDKGLDAAWQKILSDLTGVDGLFTPDFVSQSVPALRDALGTLAADIKSAQSSTGTVLKAQEIEVDQRQKAAVRSFNFALLQVDAAADAMVEPRDSHVLSISTSDYRTGAKEISVKPLYPGNAVAASLKEIRSVVLTSATLAVGGSFNHIAYETGLVPPAAEESTSTSLICATPFDFRKQAVLYAPKHLPVPVSGKGEPRANWIRAISLEVKRLIDAAGGNTLVLFSSNSDLSDIHRALNDLRLEYPMIAQRPGRAAEAEKEYRATDNAVLLGSKSFFEGLNIVGDKLWSVIIPRLPFPVPSDPVIATKLEKLQAKYESRGIPTGGARLQAFNQICVPPMLFDTVQGGGRLIRSVTDRGVLSILDPRLWTGSGSRLPTPEQSEYKGYGLTVVDALGYPRRTSKFEHISSYFAALRK